MCTHLTLACSPCPNDTFVFHDIATGKRSLPDFHIDVHLHDIELLNEMAIKQTYDITKVSFHACFKLQEFYQLLHCGAALGFGCGPLVITNRAITREKLSSCRIAIPGELTTANLLFQLWARTDNVLFVPYHRIMEMVVSGQVDAGVIIHEDRFVYKQRGLHCLADLGQWWQEQTELPIPLGCIVARRNLGDKNIHDIEGLIRGAISDALQQPDRPYTYMMEHAQNMERSVLDQHIETYVNHFTLDLGQEGLMAVETLQSMAQEAGILK